MRYLVMGGQDSRQMSSSWGWWTGKHDIGVRDKRAKVMAFCGMEAMIGFILPTWMLKDDHKERYDSYIQVDNIPTIKATLTTQLTPSHGLW